MTVLFRQFRSFVTEAPKKSTTSTATSSSVTAPPRKNRQNLQVKISKEPPTILYFEPSQDEHRECIFDPMVRHDEEKDHPDLFDCKRQNELKPWQKPPYCRANTDITLMKRLTSIMRIKSSNTTTPICPVA